MLNFIKKIFSIFSIFIIFNLTFVNSAQAGTVHTDENGDDNNLNLWLKLNVGEIENSNNTDFIFNIQEVVGYISQFMTLLPGDIISTGTPFGVGLGLNPPRYLKDGDVIELGIDGLGVSKQICEAYR